MAARNDRLNLYCSAHARHCVEMATAFQQTTGIGVDITHLDPIDALERIRTETSTPRGDVWWGGSYLVHLEAASQGLTQEYEPQRLWQLHGWAVTAVRRSNYRAFPVHAIPQRFAINVAEFSPPRRAPSCWEDLIGSSLDGRVDVRWPSETLVALAAITPLSALIGETRAVEIILRHQNNLTAPSAVSGGRRRTKLGPQVSLMLDDAYEPGVNRGIWRVVTPCEGTSFTMSAVSIVRGTYNFTGAEAWLDWTLSAEGQAISRKADPVLVPSHRSVPVPAEEIDRADLFLSGQPFGEAIGDAGQARLKTRLQSVPDPRLGK